MYLPISHKCVDVHLLVKIIATNISRTHVIINIVSINNPTSYLPCISCPSLINITTRDQNINIEQRHLNKMKSETKLVAIHKRAVDTGNDISRTECQRTRLNHLHEQSLLSLHCTLYIALVMIINYSTTRQLNLEETTRVMRAFVHLHIQTLCTAWRLCDESCSRANDDVR